jgi:hypothetical protein
MYVGSNGHTLASIVPISPLNRRFTVYFFAVYLLVRLKRRSSRCFLKGIAFRMFPAQMNGESYVLYVEYLHQVEAVCVI